MSFLFGACFNKRKYKRRSKKNDKLRMEIQKIILKAVTIVQEARALNDNDFSTDFESTCESSIQFNNQEESMSTNPDFDIIEKSAFYDETGMRESLLSHEIQRNDAISTPYSKPPIFTFGSQPEIIEHGRKAAGCNYSHLQFSSLEKELGYSAVRRCSNSIKRANELLPDYEMCKDITEWPEHEDEIKHEVIDTTMSESTSIERYGDLSGKSAEISENFQEPFSNYQTIDIGEIQHESSETTMSESTSIECYGHLSDKSADISENYHLEPFSKYQAMDIGDIISSVKEYRASRKCSNSFIGAKELLSDYQMCKDITEWREHEDEIKHEVSETTMSESKPIECYGHLSDKSADISENYQLEHFGECQAIDVGEFKSSDAWSTVNRRQIVTVTGQPDLFCPVNKPAEQGDMGDSDSEVESNSNSEMNAAMGDTEVYVYDMPELKMRQDAMMDFDIVSGMDLQRNARPQVFKALRKRSYSAIGISR